MKNNPFLLGNTQPYDMLVRTRSALTPDFFSLMRADLPWAVDYSFKATTAAALMAARPVSRAVYAPPGRDKEKRLFLEPLESDDGSTQYALGLVDRDGRYAGYLCPLSHTLTELVAHWQKKTPAFAAHADSALRACTRSLTAAASSSSRTGAVAELRDEGEDGPGGCQHTYTSEVRVSERARGELAAALYEDMMRFPSPAVRMSRVDPTYFEYRDLVSYTWTGAQASPGGRPAKGFDRTSGQIDLTSTSVLLLVSHRGLTTQVDCTVKGGLAAFNTKLQKDGLQAKRDDPREEAIAKETLELLRALSDAAADSASGGTPTAALATSTNALYVLMYWLMEEDLEGVETRVSFLGEKKATADRASVSTLLETGDGGGVHTGQIAKLIYKVRENESEGTVEGPSGIKQALYSEWLRKVSMKDFIQFRGSLDKPVGVSSFKETQKIRECTWRFGYNADYRFSLDNGESYQTVPTVAQYVVSVIHERGFFYISMSSRDGFTREPKKMVVSIEATRSQLDEFLRSPEQHFRPNQRFAWSRPRVPVVMGDRFRLLRVFLDARKDVADPNASGTQSLAPGFMKNDGYVSLNEVFNTFESFRSTTRLTFDAYYVEE